MHRIFFLLQNMDSIRFNEKDVHFQAVFLWVSEEWIWAIMMKSSVCRWAVRAKDMLIVVSKKVWENVQVCRRIHKQKSRRKRRECYKITEKPKCSRYESCRWRKRDHDHQYRRNRNPNEMFWYFWYGRITSE